MKYSIAKMQAKRFFEERKEPIRIAKANKKEEYYLLFCKEQPTKNYKVIETIDSNS